MFLNEHRIEAVGSVAGSGPPIHPDVINIAKEDLSVLGDWLDFGAIAGQRHGILWCIG